jgi:hypothetical protein
MAPLKKIKVSQLPAVSPIESTDKFYIAAKEGNTSYNDRSITLDALGFAVNASGSITITPDSASHAETASYIEGSNVDGPVDIVTLTTNQVAFGGSDNNMTSHTAFQATQSSATEVDVSITGNLDIVGTITATEFIVDVVSSSILFESGSSKFGNTLDDKHQFTGSVCITGSSFTYNGAQVITTDTTASVTYDTQLTGNLEMPSDVGGIPAGTIVDDLKGDTFISLFDDLLFPTVNPTFVAPSNGFSDDASSLIEISSSINIGFTATFNRGQILLNAVFQDFRSGLPNTYTYTGTGLPASVSSTSLTDVQNVNGYYVLQGNQSWTNTVSYDAGPQPLDNKGNNFGSPLPAGTTSAQNVSIEGVYPLFGTTSDITTLTKQSLVSMISANNISFSLVPETGGDKQKIDIPDAWTASRPLVGIQTFNTVSSQWEYQGGNAASSLTFWTTSATTQTIQTNVINYTRYTYNGVDRGAIQLRLVF